MFKTTLEFQVMNNVQDMNICMLHTYHNLMQERISKFSEMFDKIHFLFPEWLLMP